jgi:hypothetical protein
MIMLRPRRGFRCSFQTRVLLMPYFGSLILSAVVGESATLWDISRFGWQFVWLDCLREFIQRNRVLYTIGTHQVRYTKKGTLIDDWCNGRVVGQEESISIAGRIVFNA